MKSGPQGMPRDPPVSCRWNRAYRFGRSCRSFLTQGVSGSTQTLSRLFSLILKKQVGFEHSHTAPPPAQGLQHPSPLLFP